MCVRHADGKQDGIDREEPSGTERYRGVSPRCAECDALAFTWEIDGERCSVECTFCGAIVLEAGSAELGEQQRERLEEYEAERVRADGGVDRRERTGPRQATLGDRLEAGQRITSDSSPIGESVGQRIPNFEGLSGRQVAVWVAVELNGYAPRDFAGQVGIAPSTARTHLQRAREGMGASR